MHEVREPSIGERLERVRAEAASLQRQVDEQLAKDKPQALNEVFALIARYKLTRQEVGASPSWRKRAFKARGPRKAKSAA